MCYYDHATAITFKLNHWKQDRQLKNYELEAELSCQKPGAVPPSRAQTNSFVSSITFGIYKFITCRNEDSIDHEA